jgi:hypothetical protein
MSSAFTTLWTHSRGAELRRAGLVGERPSVAFGGIHTSLPSWASVEPGDDMYAIYAIKCVAYVVCRMRVVDKRCGACCGPAPTRWDEPTHPGHADWSMLGTDDCGASPVHVESTPVRFDVAIPGELLARIAWRNRRGEESRLRQVVDGRLTSTVSLQTIRRLTEASAAELAALVETVAVY